MSGLKTSFGQLYQGAFSLLQAGTKQGPDGSPVPNMVSEFIVRFMARVLADGAPYDQSKTVDPKFITSNKQVVGGKTNVTFYNGVSYPQSEHFLIVALRVLTNTNADITVGVWQPGIADGLALAGSFAIINNNSTEMTAVPFDAFPLSTNVNDQDSGFLAHEKGMLWQGQTFLTVPSVWGAAVTANYNMDFQFWGVKLI
jgi:hypothetical protein